MTIKKVLVTCECGESFATSKPRLAAGRGKYCSKACMYTYRTRPSGLTYNIVATNRGWFKKGEAPPNAGKQRPDLWKEDYGYDAIHEWVARWAIDTGECEQCGSGKNLEWSNKTGKYLRDLEDWQRLCKKCHHRYDYENFGARKVFYE